MQSLLSPMADLTETPCQSNEFTQGPELSESELAQLLDAWDLAHPTTDHPDWRHLLDEITHPHTTQAFHRLAAAAGN